MRPIRDSLVLSVLWDELNWLIQEDAAVEPATLENWAQAIKASHYLLIHPYEDARSSVPVLTSNFSLQWQKTYIDARDHRFDPVVREALTSTRMLNWSREHLPQDAAAGRVMRHRYDEGCSAGVGFPVRGPAGQFSILSFWAAEAQAFRAATRQYCAELHALAVYSHIAAYSRREPVHTLSPIEIECLRWTAQGKTAWELSVLMSLPERTVHYHIGEASRKLGAPNKTAAACIALKAGIIT